MIRKLLKQEAGYSLVEVMVSIVILAIAIIPMVGMFDTGLKSAATSGNFDKARALANQQLEKAKSQPYDIVRTNFPSEALSGKGDPGSGGVTSSAVQAPASVGLPTGSTYTVSKRFIDGQFANTNTDQSLMKVTVTVSWDTGKSYSTMGVVGK